jgi:predicted HD superfamily hydrolase involved in NAD metabolism
LKNESISDKIKSQVSEKRWKHIQGAAETAVKLAAVYGVPAHKAELAALFHDYCRSFSKEELNGYIDRIGLDDIYIDNVALSHGKAAAHFMASHYGITDDDILNAVSYHTTGRSGMSMLEKIIYIADAIEPGRNYEGVEEIRKLAFVDIDEACRRSLEMSIQFVKSKGELLHSDSVRALHFFNEKKLNKK